MLTLYTSGYNYSKRRCERIVNWFIKKELPRYKRFFTETELRTEEKIKGVTDFVESKVLTLEDDYQNQIQNIRL